jgi:hypothetical protein
MGLQNLVGISLERVTPVKETVKRLLDAAARHIADAKVRAVSAETRFSSAYTAIRMLADVVGLHANGYRTLTSRPGHHQTAIQTLPHDVGGRLSDADPVGPLAQAAESDGIHWGPHSRISGHRMRGPGAVAVRRDSRLAERKQARLVVIQGAHASKASTVTRGLWSWRNNRAICRIKFD